jgi:hypothetical protein
VNEPGFERLRRRAGAVPGDAVPRPRDAEGRQALFTPVPVQAAPGGVVVSCSRCGAESVLSAGAFARAALPSLHLPVLRRSHPSLLRCPACRRRAWCRVSVRLP